MTLQILMLIAFRITSGKSIESLVGTATICLVLGLLPPIIDSILPHQPGKKYVFFTEFQWHFISEKQLLGETITLWLSVILAGFFILWLTRNYLRAFITMILCYFLLQILTFGIYKISTIAVVLQEPNLIQLLIFLQFLTIFISYIFLNIKRLKKTLLRINHALPFSLVAALGAAMNNALWSVIVMKGIVCLIAFLLVIISNDYFDKECDSSKGGSSRPVGKDDMIFSHFFQIALILVLTQTSQYAVVLMSLFFLLWFIYHHPDIRMKRLFCATYKIEGLAALLCWLYGISTHMRSPLIPEGTYSGLFAFLVFGGFAVGSMFKDYKDIEQDRHDRIGTIYTMLLKKGKSLISIHTFVISINALIFSFPVVFYLINGRYIVGALLSVITILIISILSRVKDKKITVELTLCLISSYLIILVISPPLKL